MNQQHKFTRQTEVSLFKIFAFRSKWEEQIQYKITWNNTFKECQKNYICKKNLWTPGLRILKTKIAVHCPWTPWRQTSIFTVHGSSWHKLIKKLQLQKKTSRTITTFLLSFPLELPKVSQIFYPKCRLLEGTFSNPLDFAQKLDFWAAPNLLLR